MINKHVKSQPTWMVPIYNPWVMEKCHLHFFVIFGKLYSSPLLSMKLNRSITLIWISLMDEYMELDIVLTLALIYLFIMA